MEKVFLIVRQTYGRSPTDDLNDLDVSTAVWGIFVSVTLLAAVHLGQGFSENLQSTKNQPLKSVRQPFQTTEKLIKDQAEITGLSTIETSLLCGRAVNIANSKTCVFSDSVLFLGSLSDKPVEAWKNRIKCFFWESRYLKDRIGILAEVPKMMAELRCEPKQFK